MSYGDCSTAYFSWSAQSYNNSDEHSIGINATYAHILGLKDKDKVLVSSFTGAASVSKINVSVVSTDDWEIMEMSLSIVQSSLLDQVRVVWPGQILNIWVSKNLHFSLRVDSIEPNYQAGMLETFTDLVVEPPSGNLKNNPNVFEGSTTTSIDNSIDAVATGSNKLTNDIHMNSGTMNTDLKLSQLASSPANSVWDMFKRMLSSVTPSDTDYSNVGEIKNGDCIDVNKSCVSILKMYKWKDKSVPYRLHPLQLHYSRDTKESDLVLFQPFNAFVHRCNLPPDHEGSNSKQEIVLCKLTKVTHSIDTKVVDEHEENDRLHIKGQESSSLHPKKSSLSVYVRLNVIEDIWEGLSRKTKKHLSRMVSYSEHHCIMVSDEIRKALKATVGSRLHLSIVKHEAKDLEKIQVIADASCMKNVDVNIMFRDFVSNLTNNSLLLVNSEAVIHIPITSTFTYLTMNVRLLLLPDMKYSILHSDSLKWCTVEVIGETRGREECDDFLLDVDSTSGGDTSGNSEMFFGIATSELVAEGLCALDMSLHLRPTPLNRSRLLSNVLVVGGPGTGKTTLARHLCREVGTSPSFVHRVEIQCKQLKGKTVESLQKQLSRWIAECVYHQPSVLLLDDVDALVGVPTHQEEHSAEEVYSFRMGEMLAEAIGDVQRYNYVVVLATASSVAGLSPSVAAPRGQHFFKVVLEIPELSKDDRLESLKAMIKLKTGQTTSSLRSLDLTSHAAKAEGYVLQDVAAMVDKAIFEGWKRTLVEDRKKLVLEDRDIVEAMSNSVPLSLRGVTLHKDMSHLWADIGGLTDVKRTLIEALQWPSQYSELFARCPLRQQSGLLLYGAPGTGKTLLAGAVAHECGLNFISVKGPELLSKYIGASEEAVRNIFHKAQSARPCVLFFDEFDSLAPRRGHDSTGVTDRVVNQLLTQLDGVESLVGVWVVAATSRPDLLDPALLRPGRLDRAILCPLPSHADRLQILKAQSRKMKLALDINLKVITEQTEGFTGADLQAVLYTGQLNAVEEACKMSNLDDPDSTPSGLGAVTQAHLMSALADTRPSLPPGEKLRYQRIYDKFVGSRKGKTRDVEVVAQRVTLA